MTGLPEGTLVAFQLNPQDDSFTGEGKINHDDGKFAIIDTGNGIPTTREWSMVKGMNKLVVPITPPKVCRP